MSWSFRCGCGYYATSENGLPEQHESLSCCNCGGRKCMDCVMRHWHDDCKDSCPDCCTNNGWRPIPHAFYDDLAEDLQVNYTHNLPDPGVPNERIEAEQAPTGETNPGESGNPFTPCTCNCLCASLSWDPRAQCGCCGRECGRCEHDD